MKRITRGLDLPIAGEPAQTIHSGPPVRRVALLGEDYLGMKPTMLVSEGDRVKLGQAVFSDKRHPDVVFTAPGAGEVVAIERGAKRVFQALIIELDGDDEETFTSFRDQDLTTLTREQVQEALLQCGLWTALRARPFSKIPGPDSTPHSIFVTAIDTNPLAVRPEQVISQNENAFIYGLQGLRPLTEGPVYVCHTPGATLPGRDLDFAMFESFAGPHPAGLPGTHIHLLDPVGPRKTVWHLNYQDVIAIGKLLVTGRLDVERVISIAGPGVKSPQIVRTRLGASIDDLTQGNLAEERLRPISGSVLSGRAAVAHNAFLGRYHLQVSVLPEGGERVFLGWQRPGFDKFSVKPVFASSWLGGRKFRFSTSTEGSPRAMVPIGMYEKVMPLDIVPTYLLRALIVGDTEQAQALGALELDEEDLSLCTYVCPGKTEYGPLLRKNLTVIEHEG